MLTIVPAVAAVAMVPSVGASSASASTMSFSAHCCYDMRIADDSSSNRFHLRSTRERIVLHDASPGAAITFSGAQSRCTGEGTATLSCARQFLVSPIAVSLELGPGDSFDTGGEGCAGGWGFYLASPSWEASGKGVATVWGGTYSDRFAAYGRAVVHGCGGADILNATTGATYGGHGPDFIGARASARLIGGAGTDQLIAAAAGAAFGGAGNDQLYDLAGRSTLSGGSGNDKVGDQFCSHEDGTGDGRDRLRGGRGRDLLTAGCIARRVKGEPGAQRLVPTEPDVLNGGRGPDRAQAGRNSKVRRCGHVSWLPRIVR